MDWERDQKQEKIHPTQKPIKVLSNLISIFTDEGDIVIDPVAGSASTLIAAHGLNRKSYGFEIKKDYCYEALIKKAGTEQFIHQKDGTLMFEFQAAIANLLPKQTIFDTRDTFTDMTLPSHRRDKESKGFLTAVSFI